MFPKISLYLLPLTIPDPFSSFRAFDDETAFSRTGQRSDERDTSRDWPQPAQTGDVRDKTAGVHCAACACVCVLWLFACCPGATLCLTGLAAANSKLSSPFNTFSWDGQRKAFEYYAVTHVLTKLSSAEGSTFIFFLAVMLMTTAVTCHIQLYRYGCHRTSWTNQRLQFCAHPCSQLKSALLPSLSTLFPSPPTQTHAKTSALSFINISKSLFIFWVSNLRYSLVKVHTHKCNDTTMVQRMPWSSVNELIQIQTQNEHEWKLS